MDAHCHYCEEHGRDAAGSECLYKWKSGLHAAPGVFAAGQGDEQQLSGQVQLGERFLGLRAARRALQRQHV